MCLKSVYMCIEGGEREIRDGFVEKLAHELGHGRTWMGRDGGD